MTVPDNNDGSLFSRVADKAEWRMQFPTHDAPQKPAPAIAFDEDAYHQLAIDLDTAASLEDASDYTSDGLRIHNDYSATRARPFAVRGAGGIITYL